jgi:hypothetical protein
MQMVCFREKNERILIIKFNLGTILFAVTGGVQTSNKKVYMIDAQTGDILTSFDSNPVSSFLSLNFMIFFLKAFKCST